MERVRSVERALDILECFSESSAEIGLSELARMLNLPKATVLRLARTLESKDYLIQNNENYTYSLGPKVLKLSNIFINNLDFRNIALPYMKDLREKVEETVALYIVSGNKRMCVERVESHRTLKPAIKIGQCVSLERGSSSKLLVAFQGIRAVLDQIPHDEIDKILEQGYAITMEEREQGLSSISAPVYDSSGKVIAALSISGSTFRFTEENIEFYKKQLLNIANECSYKLGHLVRT